MHDIIALKIIEINGDERNKNNLEDIKQTCLDPTEGIGKIFHSFRIYLEKNEVLKVLKDCCHYESSCVNDWYKKVRDFSLLIVYVISGCETATQTVSNFNKDLFLEEI